MLKIGQISKRRSRRLRRMLKPLAAIALAGSICATGAAQEEYVGPSGGNWSDNANWADGTAPVSGSANLGLEFNSATISSTNQDFGSPFELQALIRGASSGSLTISGDPLKFSNLGADPIINNLGAGILTVSSDMELGNDLTVSGQTRLSGAISGASGLRFSGSGSSSELEGSTDNTFSGVTTVENGSVVRFEKFNAVAVSGDLVINGAEAQVDGFGGNQISDSANVLVKASSSDAGSLTLFRDETLGSLNLQAHGSNSAGVFSGTLTLNGDVTSIANADASGTGFSRIGSNLDLGGANRTFTVEDSLGSATDLLISSSTITNGSITKEGAGWMTINPTSSPSSISELDINAGTVSAAASIIDGHVDIASGATFKMGAGTLAGDVSGDGKLELTGSSVELAGNYLGSQSIDLSSSRFNASLKTSTATLQGSADLNFTSSAGSSAKIELGEATDVTYSGSISAANSNSGILEKTGAGTLTLTGSSNYSNETRVLEGGLKLGAANALTGKADLQIATGANVDLDGNDLEIGSLEGGGNIQLGSGNLIVGRSTSGSFGGVISGTGGLTIGPSANLRITSQQTYTGDTDIDGGRLTLAGSESLDDNADLRIANGGQLTLEGDEKVHEFTLQAGALFGQGKLTASAFNVEAGSIGTQLAGTGGLTKTGTGVVTLNGQNTYTGDTSVSEGLLRIFGSEVLDDSSVVTVNGGELNVSASVPEVVDEIILIDGEISGTEIQTAKSYDLRSGTVSADLTGNVSVNKTTAGTVELRGDNTFTGTTTISAGRLIASGGDALSTSDVVNDSILELNSNSFDGVISGTGSVETTGEVSLGGNNTYAGGTKVNSGTLEIEESSALSTGDVELVGDLRFENATDQTFSNQLSGTGNVVKNGVGELLIDQANLHSGSTTHNGGTLAIGNEMAFGSGELFVNAGAKVRGDGGARTIKNDVTFSGNDIEFTGTEDMDFGHVTDMNLAAGETWKFSNTGRTILTGDFEGLEGSTLEVSAGSAEIGDVGSFTGFRMAGDLNIAAGAELTMESAGFIDMSTLTFLNGGTLNATNGIALASSENLVGYGAVNAKVAAQLGSTISATGDLELGSSSSVVGFHSDGELRVNQNKVVIYDANDIVLGTLTEVGDGTMGGILQAGNANSSDSYDHFFLEAGKNVTGHGEIEGNFKNSGHVIGNGTALNDRIVFGADWDVSGTGEFENTLVLGDFNPGNSPGIVTGTNQAFAGKIEIELGGLTAGFGSGHHDQINDLGRIDLFDGAHLEIVNWEGFAPEFGDEFEIFTWQEGLYGDFDSLVVDSYYLDQGISFETFSTGTLQGGDGSLWLRTITAVPEPSSAIVFAALGMGLLVRRWRSC